MKDYINKKRVQKYSTTFLTAKQLKTAEKAMEKLGGKNYA